MTKSEKIKRNFKIAQYLATPLGKTNAGQIIYPSYEEAGRKFNLHPTQCFRIKRQLIGLDENGMRKQPELEVIS